MLQVSLLGIPHDDNSSFMKGPAEAPPLIRRKLCCDAYTEFSESGVDIGGAGRIRDRGDISFDTAAADPWELIERAVTDILEDGDPLICLGGDHAITHPVMRAVRRQHPKLTILHIDAHPDIYHAYQGNMRSHASPFARIMEEQLTDRLIQVGLRSLNDHHRQQFARFGVEVVEAARCGDSLRFELQTPVYVSLDIDALDPAFAPGVSHREPGGLSTRQVINLIQAIEQPIIGADIVEYNPRCDIAELTAGVAAKLVKEIAGMMIKNATPAPGARVRGS
ncbi:MAG: agmatinase [Steroidobacteraceae bacterium]